MEALSEAFYDIMEREEPELARLHACDEQGRIDPEPRARFGLFLVGWLGGPRDYMERHGHPRLRMRHMNVRVDLAGRDAWLRCMDAAMTQCGVESEIHTYLMERFSQVADFMRNVPED